MNFKIFKQKILRTRKHVPYPLLFSRNSQNIGWWKPRQVTGYLGRTSGFRAVHFPVSLPPRPADQPLVWQKNDADHGYPTHTNSFRHQRRSTCRRWPGRTESGTASTKGERSVLSRFDTLQQQHLHSRQICSLTWIDTGKVNSKRGLCSVCWRYGD